LQAREFRVALGLLCLYELHCYCKHSRSNFYSIDKNKLSWLLILLIGFTLLRAWLVLVILLVILSIVFNITVNFGVAGLAGNHTAFLLVSLMTFFSQGHAHVKERTDRDKTIREIVHDAEFNSNATFNTCFKKSVGTPFRVSLSGTKTVKN